MKKILLIFLFLTSTFIIQAQHYTCVKTAVFDLEDIQKVQLLFALKVQKFLQMREPRATMSKLMFVLLFHGFFQNSPILSYLKLRAA